jgi:transposase
MDKEQYDNIVKNVKKIKGNPRGAGRHSKLTYDLMNNIVLLVKEGNYIETAAAASGVCKQTLYNWLKRGNSVNEDSPKSEWLFAKFKDALMGALAYAESRDVKVIDKAAIEGAWQASAWRLERRNPKKWGRVKLDSEEDMYEQLNENDNNDPIIKAINNLYNAIGSVNKSGDINGE